MLRAPAPISITLWASMSSSHHRADCRATAKGMPEQLARGRKRSQPRPIVECLPAINVNELKIPRDWKVYSAPSICFRFPQLSGARLSWNRVEFRHSSGCVQAFAVKRIRTGFGYFRHAFVCNCGRSVISLYLHRGDLACVKCCDAVWASQVCSNIGRQKLQSHRIRQFLDLGLGIHPKTRQRLLSPCTSSDPVASTRIKGKALLPQGNYQINTQLRLCR